jgi:cytochrome P450
MQAAVDLPPRYSGNALANYVRMRRDPIALFTDAFEEAGDLVRIRIAYQQFLLVRSPAAIRQILVDDSQAFLREGGSVQNLRSYIGENILTTNAAEWAAQRRAMRAVLSDESGEIARSVLAQAARMVDRWTATGEHAIDIAKETMALTYQVAAATYLGYCPDDRMADQFAQGFVATETGAFHNWTVGVPFWRHVPTSRNRALRRGYSQFMAAEREAYTELSTLSNRRLIARALRDGSEPTCPVRALFTRAKRMPRIVARDFLRGLLAAAPENPSNVVSWTLYLLARHPEVLAHLRFEIDAAAGKGPLAPEHEKIPYLTMVLAESMRLYPGAWAVDRKAANDITIEGFRVPKGTQLIMCFYHLHRNPRYHPDPDRFDPERFRKPATTGPGRFAFLPFGAGSRQCVGMRAAEIQTRLIVAEVVRRVSFSLHPSERGKMNPMFTLRPKTGIQMFVQRR